MGVYYPRALVVLDVLLEDYGDGSPTDTHQIVAIPRQVTIHRNDHREADTAAVELEWRDLPLDPRAIRQARIGVYLADVGDPTAQLAPEDDEALRFVGLVDEVELEHAEGSRVRLEARDYTCLLLDQPWGGEAIPIDQSLLDVVRSVLEAVPGASGIEVVDEAGASGVVLSELLGRTRWAPQDRDDAWTVLVDLCGLVGLVPVIVLDQLRIRSATGTTGTVAAFVWGSDLTRLRARRVYNEVRTAQVQVTCWDEAARESRDATWPTEPIVLRQRVGADGQVQTDTAPLIRYYVAGSFSVDRLEDLARAIYDEGARRQVEVEIETKEMRDWLDEEDVAALANGDALLLRLQPEHERSIRSMSHGEAVAWLTSGPRGLPSLVAEALVAAVERADDLATRFYVSKAVHRWSWDGGYEVQITALNYVGPS